jgi:hypothetical protein
VFRIIIEQDDRPGVLPQFQMSGATQATPQNAQFAQPMPGIMQPMPGLAQPIPGALPPAPAVMQPKNGGMPGVALQQTVRKLVLAPTRWAEPQTTARRGSGRTLDAGTAPHWLHDAIHAVASEAAEKLTGPKPKGKGN